MWAAGCLGGVEEVLRVAWLVVMGVPGGIQRSSNYRRGRRGGKNASSSSGAVSIGS